MRAADEAHRVLTPPAEYPCMRSLSTSAADTARSLEVVVVRSPACHLCEDALESLAELAKAYPFDVRVLEIDSDEGRAIVTRYRPALSPAVVIDGRLFSSGRLPSKKLRRMLERVT